MLYEKLVKLLKYDLSVGKPFEFMRFTETSE